MTLLALENETDTGIFKSVLFIHNTESSIESKTRPPSSRIREKDHGYKLYQI